LMIKVNYGLAEATNTAASDSQTQNQETFQ